MARGWTPKKDPMREQVKSMMASAVMEAGDKKQLADATGLNYKRLIRICKDIDRLELGEIITLQRYCERKGIWTISRGL